jgi:hypothetical protein
MEQVMVSIRKVARGALCRPPRFGLPASTRPLDDLLYGRIFEFVPYSFRLGLTSYSNCKRSKRSHDRI